MWTYNYSDELYHHGILGMKWGVRRYQNKDGSLTPDGKKRLSKKNQKYIDRYNRNMANMHDDRYINAYNKTADSMNNGLIDKYNSDYEKRLIKRVGKEKAKNHNYYTDKEYNDGYEKLFNKILTKNYDEMLIDDLKNDYYYKKSQKLINKYKMYDWDEKTKNEMKRLRNVK